MFSIKMIGLVENKVYHIIPFQSKEKPNPHGHNLLLLYLARHYFYGGRFPPNKKPTQFLSYSHSSAGALSTNLKRDPEMLIPHK